MCMMDQKKILLGQIAICEDFVTTINQDTEKSLNCVGVKSVLGKIMLSEDPLYVLIEALT